MDTHRARSGSPASRTLKVGTWLFLTWNVVLLVGMTVNRACGYVGLPGLVRKLAKGGDFAADVEAMSFHLEACPAVSTISSWSPERLAWILVVVGPYPVWGLLMWFYFASTVARQRLLTPAFLSTTFLFMAFIVAARFLIKIVDFDPSGHTLVFGCEFVVLWLTLNLYFGDDRAGPSSRRSGLEELAALPIQLKLAVGLSLLLMYLGFMTTAFFHSPSEVLVTWLPVAAVFWLNEYGPLKPIGAASSSAASSPSTPSSPHGSSLRLQVEVLGRMFVASVGAWSLSTLVGLVAMLQGARIPPLLLFSTIVLDAAVWAGSYALWRQFCNRTAPSSRSKSAW